MGVGSASGVCDRCQFLNRLDEQIKYLSRLCGLLADAENLSPRKYNPGAFHLIRMTFPIVSGNVYSPGICMGAMIGQGIRTRLHQV